MARPKRFSEKLVVGLTPEIKEFLQEEAEKESCDMNAIVRKAILEYKEKRTNN
jgi:predicted HicB family RNase H-like nuclease